MALTRKTCPHCDTHNPGAFVFCPICGGSLQSVAAVAVPPRVAHTEFTLPEYLRRDYGARKRADEESGGSGFVWLGLIMILVPAISSNVSPVTLGAWAIGITSILAGLVGMRRNRVGMERAGTLLVVTAAVLLSAVGAKAMHLENRATEVLFPFNPPDANLPVIIEPVASSSGPAEEAAFTGRVLMDRGSPAHLGVLPGPGPVGNPYRAWRIDTGGTVKSTPAVWDGIVYFGSQDGQLHAVQLESGEELWSSPPGDYPISGSPAVDSGMVFATSGFSLLAFDARTGLERWRYEMAFAGAASPVVVNDSVYVASKGNYLYSVDASNGERQWLFKIEGLLFAPPTVIDGMVVIGSDNGKLYALDEKKGKMKWLLELGGGIFSPTAAQDGRGYVVTSDQTTHAVDLQEGEVIWSEPVGGSTAPVIWNDMAMIGSVDGGIYALDLTNQGETVWLAPLGSIVAPLSPVVADQLVYVSSGQSIYALSAENGEEAWHYPLSDTATTPPIVVDGVVLVGARDGYLYAITGDGRVSDAG